MGTSLDGFILPAKLFSNVGEVLSMLLLFDCKNKEALGVINEEMVWNWVNGTSL